MSAIGGVLIAAIWLPAVGSIGMFAKKELDKFQSLSTQALGQVPQRSEILDRSGHLIAYVYNVNASYFYGPGNIKVLSASGIDRAPVSYDQISPVMRRAIIAIEDSRYYQHGAIDLKGTIRALINNLQHKPVQGGSTIAQQYVKNVLILSAPNPTQAYAATTDTLSRKIHELRLAIAVEHQMSRNEILAGYLNDAYFGNQAVGIQIAAQTYFSTSAAKLTLSQAALLAGIVENPSAYDPIVQPTAAMDRRNTVLARMAQLGMITSAAAQAAEKQHLNLHPSVQQNGCTSASVRSAGFFCQYVEQVILRDSALGKTPQDRARLLATGGLKIYTTLDGTDQRAAANAVNFMMPPYGGPFNPPHNADTQALIQPGTGKIRAMAQDRFYGTGPGHTEINYAVDTAYGGSQYGVQTGSSSKLFTLITALEQGLPFGFTLTVPSTQTVFGYNSCNGSGIGGFKVTNAEGAGGKPTTYSLYTGTTNSINVFYANLEKKVGLCNVVQTAVRLGVHRVDGVSLLKSDGPGQLPADDIASFTLGPIGVSPLTMAAAYASVAARGIYCNPVAINKIVTDANRSLPVPGAGCHRVMTAAIADAVNYVLQGVLTNGTAAGDGISRPAAGKTGTANGSAYAAFGGYTPTLVGYVSAFNPVNPTSHPMSGAGSCYRFGCPNEMFGAMAPGQTWQLTFQHANLGPPLGFVPVPPTSLLFRLGTGQVVKQPKPPKSPGPGHSPGPPQCPKNFPICPGH
jgi:membrane peptidoglycan carboxypeptidase